MGAVASHVKVMSLYALLPAASVAVKRIVYTSSAEADIVVDKAVELPKVIVPVPACFVQAYVMEFASVAVAVCVNCAFLVWFDPALTVGAVLSTVKVVLAEDAGAELPAVSVAVPAAMVMPSVPFPVMLEMVTVLVVPVPLTAIVPVAVLVVLSVILPTANVLLLKFVSA